MQTDDAQDAALLAQTGWRTEVQIKPKRNLMYFTWRKGRGKARQSNYGGKAVYLNAGRKSEYQQRTGRNIDAAATVPAGRPQSQA